MNLVADQDIPYLDTFFNNTMNITLLPGRDIRREHLQKADGLLVRSITQINGSLLKDTPIKWVGSLTAGIDHIDTHWLQTHHIAWRACPGFNAPPVADYVIASIAALKSDGYLQQNNMRAAVIGIGQVGTLVTERLKTLQFDVTLIDPLRAENEADFQSQSLHDVHDLDVICVHTPLTKEGQHATYHLIGADVMQRQKPGCVLLNAARGAVVDTHALISYGKHLTTCLDVFEHEPMISLDVLNAAHLATPHIAGHTIESKWRGLASLYTWMTEQAGLAAPDIAYHLPSYRVAIPKEIRSWHHIVQHVFDVAQLTRNMQDTLTSAETIKTGFDVIRKQYGNRHEFSNTVLLTSEQVKPQDQQILERLGFTLQKNIP